VLSDRKGINRNGSNIYLAIVVFLIIAIPTFIYSVNFMEYGLPKKTIHWGHFGSYFGGVVGPFLTLITFYFVIKQINISEKNSRIQTDLIEVSRKSDVLMSEINFTYDRLYKKSEEKLAAPMENLVVIMSRTPSNKRWVHEYSNKITTIYEDGDKELTSLPWIGAVSWLLELRAKKGTLEIKRMYKSNEISYSAIHRTISGELLNLIVCCKHLAEIDKESYGAIKIKLATFSQIFHLYNDLGLIGEEVLSLLYKLQSLELLTDRLDVDLKKQFFQEMSVLNLIKDKSSFTEMNLEEMLVVDGNSKHVKYRVSICDEVFERYKGCWKKM